MGDSHGVGRGGPSALLAWLLLFAPTSYAAPPQLKYFFPAGAQLAKQLISKLTESSIPGLFRRGSISPGITLSPKEKKGELKVTVAAGRHPGRVLVASLRRRGDKFASAADRWQPAGGERTRAK